VVSFVDTTPAIALKMGQLLLARVVNRYLRLRPDWGGVNQQLSKQIEQNEFDVLWIDKGTDIKPAVFHAFRRRFPKGKIIGYSPDDMMVAANKSRLFMATLPYYDAFFTTKSFHLEELKSLGCKRVRFIDNGFDDRIHRPLQLTAEERERFGHPVIFIGAYEEERANYIRYLAENGVSVRVWGDELWNNVVNPPPLMRLECRPVFSDAYTKAVCASDICLCFLRKLNRDLQTTRSVEIPACGTLMVAERSKEHQDLFDDGKEAVFFDDKEELLERVRYYLANNSERKAIALAGRQRCVEGGYSNLERMRKMLKDAFNEL